MPGLSGLFLNNANHDWSYVMTPNPHGGLVANEGTMKLSSGFGLGGTREGAIS